MSAADVYITERVLLGTGLSNPSVPRALVPIIAKKGSTSPQYFESVAALTNHYGDFDPLVSGTVKAAIDFLTLKNPNSNTRGVHTLRVCGDNAVYSGLVLAANSSGVLSWHPMGLTDVTNIDGLVAGKESVVGFYAKRGPGSHGDAVSVEIVGDTTSTALITSVTASASTNTGELPEGQYELWVAPIFSNGEASATKVVFTGASGFSGAVQLQWAAVTNAIGYAVYGRIQGQQGRLATVGAASGTVTYTDYGVTVPSYGIKPSEAATATFLDRPFTVKVVNNATGSSESFSVTLKEYVSGGVQFEIESRMAGSLEVGVISNVLALDKLPMIGSMPATALTGGDSGAAPTSTQIVDALQVFAARNKYEFGVILNGGIADPIVQQGLTDLAAKRGVSLAFLDTPAEYQTAEGSVAYRRLVLGGACTDYAALFTGDPLTTYNGSQVYSPMSGVAGAAWAYTQEVASPGHSIAGLNRGQIPCIAPRYVFDEAECNQLSDAQVNYMRVLPTTPNPALWEQYTLNPKGMALISVRNIVNTVKTVVPRYLYWALQEMNTDSVRRELSTVINNFLTRQVETDALAAGVFICDSRNNPLAAAQAGRMYALLRLSPHNVIHDIVLAIEVTQGGVSFQELTIASSNKTLEFSSGTALPSGSSHITNDFSSGTALPSGSSHTTIEYSSGALLPYGQSHTTNEYSSTRPF